MFARRFSLVPLFFFALWLLWLFLPPTREVARRQWTARLTTLPTPSPYSLSVLPGDTSRDAAFVRALNASGNVYVPGQSNKRSNALEELGHQFPDDPAICAAQIVSTSTDLHLYASRQPGPSSSAEPSWSVKLAKAKIEGPSPEVLESWFAATARGAKLEPNNTFWDWAQIMGLLAANRDDEVWPVLRAARNKTGYDEHINEGTLARLRLDQQRGAMPPIQQIGIAASALFPHYATMREAARHISDNASGLRLLGDTTKQKQALEGLRDFAQMARVMRRESKSFIGSLVGAAMESIALYGGSYSPVATKFGRRPTFGSSVATYGRDPRSLLSFARQQRRTDIVAQLSRQWVEMGKWRAATRGAAGDSLLIGLNVRDVAMAQGGDWFGALLIAGIPTLLAVALGCSLLLRFVPAWKREREAQPSLFSWGWSIFLSVESLVVLSSPALWALISAWRTPGASLFDLLFAPFGASGGTPIAPLTWQYHFPALLGFLCALWFASLWDARRQGSPSLTTRLRGLFHAPDDGMARFDVAPLLTLVAILAAFFLLTVGVLAYLIVPTTNNDFKSLHDYAGLTLLGFTFILSFPWLLRLRTAPGIAFALILARRFAWGQLIFLSLLWGILLLVSTPAQHRFDAQFTRQLQIGEFQLIRQKAGL